MPRRAAPLVAVAMGSDSDLPVMNECLRILERFSVPYECVVVSAHRTPDRCRQFVRSAVARGAKVIIAGAGRAAHLPGVIASYTTVPVVGVPLDAGMSGLDALLSIAQMPAGVPVACMAVGKSGAANAALLAVEILATSDYNLARHLKQHRRHMAAEVARKSRLISAKSGSVDKT
ncbi:MAG: 5-(carboxyamino)imidazole ribonucleotide mutase [candidate division WOR-3 bacterium]